MNNISSKFIFSKLNQYKLSKDILRQERTSSNNSETRLRNSRSAMRIEDLPSPEEAFRLSRFGIEELVLLIVGPGLVATGLAIGIGDRMIAPLNFTPAGIQGIGLFILISAILQVFYNIELGRLTVATGESPLAAIKRILPRPFAFLLLLMVLAYPFVMLSNWTIDSGASLFSLINGRASYPEEANLIKYLGILLLTGGLFILAIGKRVERMMETLQLIFLPYIFFGLLFVVISVVPFEFYKEFLLGLTTPIFPSEDLGIQNFQGLARFMVVTSSMNLLFVAYYQDKGYGMGSKNGYINGLFFGAGNKPPSVGRIFPENELNSRNWSRWFRILKIDQWAIYFPGLILGILFINTLIAYLTKTTAASPESGSVLIFASEQLGQRFGLVLGGWSSLTGTVIMFSTQLIIMELIARNLSGFFSMGDSRVGRWLQLNARKTYFIVMGGLILLVVTMVNQRLSETIQLVAINITAISVVIFPLLIMLLNHKLPKPARSPWQSYIILLAYFSIVGILFSVLMESFLFE